MEKDKIIRFYREDGSAMPWRITMVDRNYLIREIDVLVHIISKDIK
jgi:hypothetical protein